ncbi:Zn(II)2Cys6 transcription factor [Aspergillus ibericus CBS 121593]|uniref:C6 transcription factor n=1 Tax=Aspergillus ibericus CBS 121593 TaxID=1448316 RepID=A0A395GJH6_9EURO|nr:C6 transcription factor [Aspergillus ibericus CBS 121593]RAK95442.1 C6 transcription factor [Aspergillus ibericus CBS 121593]
MQKGPRRSTARSRTPKACDRCRRQKLKCDTIRPCVLCTRAGHKCDTTLQPRRSERRRPSTGTPSVESPDTLVLPDRVPEAPQQYATGTSAIAFARQVYNEEEMGRTLTEASVPGDIGMAGTDDDLWGLKETNLPPQEVILALIDTYFYRMQWFILVLHEPSFRETAQRIISQQQWRRRDLGAVMTVLAVATISLQAVLPDQEWPGHSLLCAHSIDAKELLKKLIAEIRSRLLDLLEDCRIEGVQVCLLLSCYYMFHSSPNLAWTMFGMAARAGYALNLQSKSPSLHPSIADETRSRCWNHIIVSDTFCSIIYGRPASLESTIVRPLQLVDDLTIDPWLLNQFPVHDGSGLTSRAAFHVLKAEIYAVAGDILQRFRRLNLPSEAKEQGLEAIVQTTQESDALLNNWRARIPRLYDFEYWNLDGRWDRMHEQLQTLPLSTKEQVETVYLQAVTLQLTYDGMVIQAHRPLLEQKMNRLTPRTVIDAVHRSLSLATAAALRVSRIPIHIFRNHFAVAFASMQQFTAGVILCIPPTVQPLTATAHEAKDGVVRIIRASRSLVCYDRIARQTEQLLTELLKVTIQRELTHALAENPETNPDAATSTRHGSSVTEDSITTHAVITPATDQTSDPIPRPWASDPLAAVMGPYDFLPAQAFQQLDDTFGAFGECECH